MKVNFLIWFSLSVLFFSCATKEKNVHQFPQAYEVEIPNKEIDKLSLTYDNKTSTWKEKENLYSGYVYSYYDSGEVKEKFGVYNGKKQNKASFYFQDGHLKNLANYHDGKLHGEKKTWSVDTSHTLVSHFNYYLGKADGVQKKWYPTGEVYQILNLNMGKEEGMQQAYRKNGKLYANYEAIDGRVFGLKRSALCVGVKDENVDYEK